MKISAYVTNLGKYNDGQLVGAWLDFPASDEEIAAVLDEIEIKPGTVYEEYFITDYETDVDLGLGEFIPLEKVNEIAEKLAGLDDYTAEIVEALLGYGYEIDEAIDAADDCIYYDGCSSMADVAERLADETGLLDSIPDNLRYYFDFEAFGRDLDLNGTWIETNCGFIEVLR